MMKSSTLFVVGHRPPYVHLASTRRHSRDKCSQAFPVFHALSPPCIILNANRRTKNGVGLGTRLANVYIHQIKAMVCASMGGQFLWDLQRQWDVELGC